MHLTRVCSFQGGVLRFYEIRLTSVGGTLGVMLPRYVMCLTPACEALGGTFRLSQIYLIGIVSSRNSSFFLVGFCLGENLDQG